MNADVLRSHILRVGRADSIIIEIPPPAEERVIGVIDCFNFKYTRKYLENNGIKPTRVQFVVATHPHNDHIGGLPNLIKYFLDKEVEICGFWDCGYHRPIKAWYKLQELIEQELRDVTIFPKSDEEPFLFGNQHRPVVIRVLAPVRQMDYWKHIANNNSIVISITFGRARLLFGADAEVESWGNVIKCKHRDFIRSGFLKVPHHGSVRGPGYQFIVDYIVPKVAVITGNNSMQSRRGSFPNRVTVSALERAGAKIGCTFDHGDIMIESHPQGKHDIYF